MPCLIRDQGTERERGNYIFGFYNYGRKRRSDLNRFLTWTRIGESRPTRFTANKNLSQYDNKGVVLLDPDSFKCASRSCLGTLPNFSRSLNKFWQDESSPLKAKSDDSLLTICYSCLSPQNAEQALDKIMTGKYFPHTKSVALVKLCCCYCYCSCCWGLLQLLSATCAVDLDMLLNYCLTMKWPTLRRRCCNFRDDMNELHDALRTMPLSTTVACHLDFDLSVLNRRQNFEVEKTLAHQLMLSRHYPARCCCEIWHLCYCSELELWLVSFFPDLATSSWSVIPCGRVDYWSGSSADCGWLWSGFCYPRSAGGLRPKPWPTGRMAKPN